MPSSWELRMHTSSSMPALAWVLRARPPVAELTFGSLVKTSDIGIFEGTWVGNDDLEHLARRNPR